MIELLLAAALGGAPAQRSVYHRFGLSCVEYWDDGPHFHFDGNPPVEVLIWLQLSDSGRRANVPMPQVLQQNRLPECPPGRHHL